jgi:hypothetical protein
MTRTGVLIPALVLGACSSSSSTPATADAASATDAAVRTDAASATDAAVSTDAASGRCAARLVRLRTGSDSACGGQNAHFWPIGLAPTDCHGWSSRDTTGRQHDNSANTIRCNADGSFSFTQFAGNLNCSGTGTVKTYRLNTCAQDIPPTLYTVADDLSCCSAPDSAACTTGNPSVSVAGSTIYLNGTSCAN